ncbi:2'-5' RNA ligase family protein [Haloquadratum walsbyi]|jgi:hypothetical protein|uniref:2'-5' RNA ligase family protein n=1 Tax=Haloquadratum walsbyi J07HQW2 TaxID=1238425 RepID=U1NGG3_9EURY|nr:2'-5' RNA ligase family protein [Haloquadratum walsbyi]ERG95903.1 MAG: hypothetical protein J07HQW2_02363 [Haloquadratum walsbyi J07HQW2]
MFSLNIPLPPKISQLTSSLHAELMAFDNRRERQTLVLKRFETDTTTPRGGQISADISLPVLRERLRPILTSSTTPNQIEVSITGIDFFENPPGGTAPVVYLAVESQSLMTLHNYLCKSFDAIAGLEGSDYVPHVTLARGGETADAVQFIKQRSIDPIKWSVNTLQIWDNRYRENAAQINLSAR